MRRIAIVIALLGIGGANAQMLYQCAARAGNIYQQTPCPATTRTVRTMETSPEPPPTPEQLAERAQKLAQDRAESAFLSHQAGTDRLPTTMRGVRSLRRGSVVAGAVDQCSAAKTRRAHLLRSVGLDRTMELLSRLDDEVADACAH